MSNSVTQNFLFSRILVAVCAVMVLFVVPVVAQTGTWQKMDVPLANIRTMTSNGSTLIIGTGNSGIFRSEDDGETWLPTSANTPLTTPTTVIANGATFYIGTSKGVFRSSSSTTSSLEWNKFGQNLSDPVNALWATESGKILMATDKGIFEYINDMDQWKSKDQVEQKITSFAGFVNVVIAGGDSGKVYRSNNAGQEWQELQKIPTSVTISALVMPTANTILAGTTTGTVYRSLDTGRTWDIILSVEFMRKGVGNPIFTRENVTLARRFGSAIFLGIGEALCVSQDVGTTWSIFLPSIVLGRNDGASFVQYLDSVRAGLSSRP